MTRRDRTAAVVEPPYDALIAEMEHAAAGLPVGPASVIMFGSMARGEADATSDIDVLFVRPDGVAETDEDWAASVQEWKDTVRRIAGNAVDVLEVGSEEIATRLASGQGAWRDIRRQGLVIHGMNMDDLEDRTDAGAR